MNERIKELAEQAGIFTNKTSGELHGYIHSLERFAELVRQDERQALAQEQTKCPRCGEVNPAEIHTCSPQVAQPEREWVGLTDEEKLISIWKDGSFHHGVEWAEAKLKEKNNA